MTTPPARRPMPAALARATHKAGVIGGGIAWLGLGIAQACALLLLLPALVGSFSYSIGWTSYGADAEPPAVGVMAWFTSPWGYALLAGITLGVVAWLAGLRASSRLLRADGASRARTITWLGFAIVAATGGLLAAVGCGAILAAFGGPGAILALPGFVETPRASANGWPSGMFAPAQLLPEVAPVVAFATFAPLLVPIALSAPAWWVAARALRAPAMREAAR